MAVKKKTKTKVVVTSVKVPSDCYERVREVCKVQSGKSFSQFAREAIDEKLEKSEASLEVGC